MTEKGWDLLTHESAEKSHQGHHGRRRGSDVQHAVKRADHQTHGERYKGKLHRLFYRLEVLGLANAHFVPTGLPHQDGFLDTSCAF
jgi:hypothetical protein